MKALTIHQPYASLVALGVKSIETRSWRAPVSLVGQRFAIHAAAKRPTFGRLGRTLTWDADSPKVQVDGEPHPLPLGAVVATAVLADCVPMVGNGEPHPEGRSLLLSDPEHGMRFCTLSRANGGSRAVLEPCEDQRPFGDFTPGRWAWLLDSVEPCDPIPAKGRPGLWDLPLEAFGEVVA